jgi:hypothetical protein
MPNTHKPKNRRIPMAPDQQQTLTDLLSQVPVRKVLMYDWRSEAGRAFIKELRRVQVKGGVSLPWIADTLDVSRSALDGAVSYWERRSASRTTSSRRRQPRTLRKATET